MHVRTSSQWLTRFLRAHSHFVCESLGIFGLVMRHGGCDMYSDGQCAAAGDALGSFLQSLPGSELFEK